MAAPCLRRFVVLFGLICWAGSAAPLSAETVHFSDVVFGPNPYVNGPVAGGTESPDPWGGSQPIVSGNLHSGGIAFANSHNANYGSWSGFAFSQVVDVTTPGYGNQFAAYAGAGGGIGGPGDAYGVAFGSSYQPLFNPNNPAHLAELPNFTLANGASIVGAWVTNTTYTALSMELGDGFAKQFGGVTGNDPDYFMLTAYGTDAAGTTLLGTAQIYLADFTSPVNALDRILAAWTYFDLTALNGAQRVFFNRTSSDSSEFGMNTPASFAIDDIVFALNDSVQTPEPATITTLAVMAAAALGLRSWRRRQSQSF